MHGPDDAAARAGVAVRINLCRDERSTHGGRQGELRESWVQFPSDEQETPVAAYFILRDIIPRRHARVLSYSRRYVRDDFLETDDVRVLLGQRREEQFEAFGLAPVIEPQIPGHDAHAVRGAKFPLRPRVVPRRERGHRRREQKEAFHAPPMLKLDSVTAPQRVAAVNPSWP